MKKRFVSLLLVLIICLAPVSAALAANVSLGHFTQFTVTVTAQMGSVLYYEAWSEADGALILRPSTICIPTKTMLVVTDEIQYNGVLYFGVSFENEYGYIKQKDATLTKPIAGPEVSYETAETRTVAVADKNGLLLRNGPSFAYSTVGETIPYGTKLTYDKVNCANEYDAQWAYTKHNDIGGWIYIYPYGSAGKPGCAFTLDESSNYTGVITTLTDGAYLTETANGDSAKVCENIPADTVLSFRYYYENYDSISAYVEYDGVKGWLKARNNGYKTATGVKGGVYVLNKDGMPLYENAVDENRKVLSTVPADTNLCVDYIDVDTQGIAMHVEYGGKEGWLISENTSDYVYMELAYSVEIKKADGVELYSSLSEGSEVISVIPEGTVLTCIYETSVSKNGYTFYCNYVEYGGKLGWIIATNDEAQLIEGSQKQLDAPAGAPPIERDKPSDAPEIEAVASSSDSEPGGLSTVHIVLICVGAAAVIGIIVFVTVRKKKSK